MINSNEIFISNPYNKIHELSNLSFLFNYYFVYKENSILFIDSLSNYNSSQISQRIKEKNYNIKVIITSENEQNLDLNDLKKFVIDNSIPIYFIEKLIYDKIFNFFFMWKM